MNRSPFRIILVVAAWSALGAPTAHAATPASIHRDAADGSIDGRYSLADLRAADRTVSAEQREYYGWDDVLAEHVRARGTRAGTSGSASSAPDSPSFTADALARRVDTKPAHGRAIARGAVSSTSSPRSGPNRSTGDNAGRRSDSSVVAAGGVVRPDRARSDALVPAPWLFASIPLLVLGIGAGRFTHARRARPTRR